MPHDGKTHDIGDVIQNKKIAVLSFVLGFSALTAQTLILRAFQVVFYGNELSYAVTLSSWLFWAGMGSALTAFLIPHFKRYQPLCILGFLSLALTIPCCVFGTRYIKPILDVAIGQVLGIGSMIIAGFLLTAPVAFCAGMLFVVLCALPEDQGERIPYRIGYVYFWEALGSGAAGMIFSYILIHMFRTTAIAWLTAVMISAVLFLYFRRVKRWNVLVISFFVFLLTFLGIDGVYHLERLSQEKQWPGGTVVFVGDTPYANIAVIEQQGELSFYQDGLHSFTVGDRLSVEENTHFALLAHPDPHRVLLLGNGLGGEISEILKYPGVVLDYVEVDSGFLSIARKALSDSYVHFLDHPRVNVHRMDPRRFVNTTENQYDVVIVNVGDPQTARVNRFYTLEFFADLDRILNIGGIASWRVTSSENYLSPENRRFLRSLYSTMKEVFPEVKSIPGGTHTFLVSNITDRIFLSPRWFSERLRGHGFETQFVSEYTIPFLIDQRRVQEAENILTGEKGFINRDLFPQVYLFNIILWSTHFNSGFKDFMGHVSVPFWLVLGLSLCALAGWGYWKQRTDRLSAVDIAVVVTGFSEILFQIIVILIFQALYGIAYEKIGLILGSFMLGLVSGTSVAMRFSKQPREVIFIVFRRVQAGIVVYPLLLPLLFSFFRDVWIAQRWVEIFSFLFGCLPFAAGMLGGIQFPLAALIRRRKGRGEEAGSAGLLYAGDLFGSAAGALLAGTFLIPLYGIVAVCLWCALMNAAVFLFLARVRMPHRSESAKERPEIV